MSNNEFWDSFFDDVWEKNETNFDKKMEQITFDEHCKKHPLFVVLPGDNINEPEMFSVIRKKTREEDDNEIMEHYQSLIGDTEKEMDLCVPKMVNRMGGTNKPPVSRLAKLSKMVFLNNF